MSRATDSKSTVGRVGFASRTVFVWAPVVTAMIVVTVAVVLVIRWQQQADHARTEQVLFAKLEASANHQNSLEDEALSTGRVTKDLLDDMQNSRAQARMHLAELGREGPPDELENEGIPAAFITYGDLIAQELSLLDARRVQAAREFDDQRVDPTFEHLRQLLAVADSEHEEEAERARHRAAVGSAVTAGIALVLVVLLLLGFQRQRERLVRTRAEEQSIRRSEKRYRQIIETTIEGVWVVDSTYRTTFVNATLAEMLGYQPADMLGKTFLEFMDEESAAIAREQLGTRRAGELGLIEVRYKRADGSDLWALVSTSEVMDDEGNTQGRSRWLRTSPIARISKSNCDTRRSTINSPGCPTERCSRIV
jgi:PAS domain S-box-containing protein